MNPFSMLDDLQKPSFRCTVSHLRSAADNLGVLRLLLQHPSCRPWELLPWAIEGGKDSVVTALLEAPRVVFEPKGDPAMLACCRHDNARAAELILKDPRFSTRDAHEYTLEAVEACSLSVLGVLRQRGHLFFPAEQRCSLLQAGSATGNALVFGALTDVLGVCEWSLTLCTRFTEMFSGALEKYVKTHSNVSLIVAFACSEENRIAAFRLMAPHLKRGDLWKVFFQSAERGSIAQLSYLLDLRKLEVSPRMLGIDLTRGTACLEYLLKERAVPVCDSDLRCSLCLACVRCEESVILLMLEHSGYCRHLEDLIPRVTDLKYFTAAREMVEMLKGAIKDTTLLAVLKSGSTEVIDALLGRVKHVREEIVLLCLRAGHLEAVHSVSSRFRLDLSWSGYALLRAAAEDETGLSFRALGL